MMTRISKSLLTRVQRFRTKSDRNLNFWSQNFQHDKSGGFGCTLGTIWIKTLQP